MRSAFQRRLWVLLLAGAAAYGCWKRLPGTEVDRLFCTSVARAHYNPPLIVDGGGSLKDPWTLKTFSLGQPIPVGQMPGIVSLADDPSGFFQENPHSALDVAVILRNIHRLGARDTAVSTVLAWDAPDPMGLAALDKAIGEFRSVVMSAPLSRAAVPEPLPPSFRNASVPLSQVNGDARLLPVVNRIPMPGIILGGDNCMAGFQSLDSEDGPANRHLLAVWDDRVVFAFPLAVAVRNLGVAPDQIVIRPGEFIRLGAKGPVIPIDRHGRILTTPGGPPPACVIRAEDLIDAPADHLPAVLRDRMILRDDRSAASRSTREVSDSLAAMVGAISADDGQCASRVFQRPSPRAEWSMLAAVLILAALAAKLPAFPRHVVFLTIASGCVVAQVVALGFGWWLPGATALAALCAAIPVSAVVPLRRKPEPAGGAPAA